MRVRRRSLKRDGPASRRQRHTLIRRFAPPSPIRKRESVAVSALHLSPRPTPPLTCDHLNSRGAAIRRHAVGGVEGGACGRVCTPLPGGCGNRPGGNTAPVRGARWEVSGGARARTPRRDEAKSRTGVEGRGERPTGPRSADRSFQIAASGAPRGVRMVAQPIRAAVGFGHGPLPTRLAALRCPSSGTSAHIARAGFGLPGFRAGGFATTEVLGKGLRWIG